MTMLDRMRRHRDWLKWSLGLVCVAFVLFYIPDFLRSADPTVLGNDAVAVIDGQEIRSDEFRRIYQGQLDSYRAAYGNNVSAQLLKQLGIEQQILQQMVDERAALVEARRLGLKVTDEEVARRIYSIPAFLDNGTFIGAQRYQQVLASQRPPLSISEFEDGIRRSLVSEKLRSSVTEWLSVSDKELEQEYRRRNDKIKLGIITFPTDSYRAGLSASDADVASYFDAHSADFKIPEKRKVKYVLIDVDALRAKVTVSDSDLERQYNENIEQYTTPEQIRASHILLKTEGKDDAAVKARAEDILKQAKSGSDFAALAQKYSEDESNAKSGGDLDFFSKGRMVPEFEEVAFTMQPGQISDLVKTEYGYHIIKLTDKKPGSTRKLEEVKPQLTEQLASQRAAAQATDLAQEMEKQITKPADIDTVAKARGLAVQETGLFARDEPVLGVGSAPEMTSRAFSMNVGDVSPALRTGRGFVFETLVEKKDAYVPKLDEVKERVRDTVITERAREVARQKATEMVARLKSAPDFDKAAKAANLEVKTTDQIARDSPRADLAATADVVEAAFALPEGAVSDPISTASGTVIVKVIQKVEMTPTIFAIDKDKFRDELLTDRRNRFYSAYMGKAKQKMKIEVNREAVQRVVG